MTIVQKNGRSVFGCSLLVTLLAGAWAPLPAKAQTGGPADFLVDELRIDLFKRNLSDLQAFGTRFWAEQGNIDAVNQIKAKLESYGYTNVTLDPYTFQGETRHNVYATKVGSVTPTEMYIVGAHMDSFSLIDTTDAPGVDDDGSGTSLVLELARVFAKTRTDVSVRFVLWNNEETGLDGSEAYVAGHRAAQGTLAEPTWLGMIQHDMIMFDRTSPVPDADIEYQANNDFGGAAITLANTVAAAMAKYGTMPAQVSGNMNNTDSRSFQDDTPAISVRENRRIAEIGNGSNPHWHQPTDRTDTFSEADYAFGFNIVKMTAGAVAELVNAQPDCDMDGTTDSDEITGGAADVNNDGIPDSCQDCDSAGGLDPEQVAGDPSIDCNGNGKPDTCDLLDGFSSVDCDGDSIPDECQLPTEDCNRNFIVDFCDVRDATSDDIDNNGEPDECQCAPPEDPIAEGYILPASGTYAPKNRYLSFVPPSVPILGADGVAFRVNFTQMPGPDDCALIPDYSAFQNQDMWVGEEIDGINTSGVPGSTGVFRLQDTPLYRDWLSAVPRYCVGASGTQVGESLVCDSAQNETKCTSSGGTCQPLVIVSDCNIVPCAVYTVAAITNICATDESTNFSNSILLETTALGAACPSPDARWADIVGTFDPALNRYNPADGCVDFNDVAALIERFKNITKAPPRTWCDLIGGPGDVSEETLWQGAIFNIDFGDVQTLIGAFKGDEYPLGGPTAPDPCP